MVKGDLKETSFDLVRLWSPLGDLLFDPGPMTNYSNIHIF